MDNECGNTALNGSIFDAVFHTLHSERMARIAKEKMDEAKIEIITNMLKADLPLEIISTVTDYCVEEILRIKQDLAG